MRVAGASALIGGVGLHGTTECAQVRFPYQLGVALSGGTKCLLAAMGAAKAEVEFGAKREAALHLARIAEVEPATVSMLFSRSSARVTRTSSTRPSAPARCSRSSISGSRPTSDGSTNPQSGFRRPWSSSAPAISASRSLAPSPRAGTRLGRGSRVGSAMSWLVASLESRRDMHDEMDGPEDEGAAVAYRVALLLVEQASAPRAGDLGATGTVPRMPGKPGPPPRDTLGHRTHERIAHLESAGARAFEHAEREDAVTHAALDVMTIGGGL